MPHHTRESLLNADLVIGLDSSTTATKAIAWTREGVEVAEGRSAIPLSRPAANWYEQDAEDWWRSACDALRGVLAQVAPQRIAALAISPKRRSSPTTSVAGWWHAMAHAHQWMTS